VTALPTIRDEQWRYSKPDRLTVLPAPEHISVPAGETVTRLIVQDAALDIAAVHDMTVDVGAGGRFVVRIVNTGGALGRVAIDVTLGDGADFALDGALIAGGEQTVEIVTIVRHAAPNATSRQTVRAIAAQRGTVNYLGKVAVARHAQKTDAVQSAKAMLLARTATANLKPELEIFADDVKCAHGATVGELDANSLFYLASRGLPPADAKALLLRAFVEGLFDDLDEDDGARVGAAIDAALGRVL
jgi:Fe-S cluster assembly protein SufD